MMERNNRAKALEAVNWTLSHDPKHAEASRLLHELAAAGTHDEGPGEAG